MVQVSKQMEQDDIHRRIKENKRAQKKLLSGPKKEIPDPIQAPKRELPPPPPFQIILNEQTPKVLGKADPIADKELIAGFTMFARTLPNCVGLAANQATYKGKRIKKRFFVLTDGENWYPILNPKVIKKYGQSVPKIEGCKTWPGKAILAQRYIKLDIEYQDHNGVHKTHHFDGYGAQIIQHETDHLNGVPEVFTDKMVSGKQGRNDTCKCGSGKKYKKCCIKHEN